MIAKDIRVVPAVPHARQLLRRRRRRERVRHVRPAVLGLVARHGEDRPRARQHPQEQLPALVHGRRVLPLRHRHDRRLHRVRLDRVRRLVPLVPRRPSRPCRSSTSACTSCIVMFVPSILFWPSSIGKEALMQFAIGSAALGTAHLFNGKLVRGLLVGVPGAWLMWVVRPHLLALVVLARRGRVPLRPGPARGTSRRAQHVADQTDRHGASSRSSWCSRSVRARSRSASRRSRSARCRPSSTRPRSAPVRAVPRSTTAATRLSPLPLAAGHGHGAAAAVPVGGQQPAPAARVARRHRARWRSSSSGAGRSRSRCDICDRCRSSSTAGRSRSCTASRSRRSPTSACSSGNARSCCPRSTCSLCLDWRRAREFDRRPARARRDPSSRIRAWRHLAPSSGAR